MQGVTCFTPPPLIPYPNENKFFLVRARIRINWLTKQFRVSLAAKASDVLVQRYAHYHILVWLGSILFMDNSAQWILSCLDLNHASIVLQPNPQYKEV